MLSLDSSEGSGASDPLGIGFQGHLRLFQDMIEAITAGRPPLVDGVEGRKAVEIICAIYRSQQLGQPIMLQV
jgi:UDP-N-acetyl-2-amino-2-deoxyglucuronate dehydrogenase